MSDFLQAVKRAAVDAVLATQPSEPFVGTVSSVSPLRVRLNQRLVLEAGHLLCLSDIGDLGRGDTVALLRFAGGQKYLILGRLSV